MKIQKQASVLTAGTPDAEQLEKINRQAKSPLKAEEVYVFSVRLCDDQPDRDHERFSTEALKALAPMFVGKTGIVDHAWSSEKQVARIFEAGVEYGDGCAFLKAWAYILRGEKTQEIIREIEAGIKKEVSVGCAMRRSICSICGADYGSCEHRKGESYGGQTYDADGGRTAAADASADAERAAVGAGGQRVFRRTDRAAHTDAGNGGRFQHSGTALHGRNFPLL